MSANTDTYGPYPSTQSELVRNKILVGLGVTFLGGLIGFAYGYYKNQKAKASGLTTLESDLASAFEGALFGIIIAVISILACIVYHARAVRSQGKTEREAQLTALQTARVARYQAVSKGLENLSPGAHTAAAVGLVPTSLTTNIQPLAAAAAAKK